MKINEGTIKVVTIQTAFFNAPFCHDFIRYHRCSVTCVNRRDLITSFRSLERILWVCVFGVPLSVLDSCILS